AYRKASLAQQNGIRGIERRQQLARENGVVERDAIGANGGVRVERCNLRHERIAHLVICIKAQDPIGGDLCLLDCIPPLVSMAIESALENAHIGKARQYRQRPVRTTAVDNDNILRPGKMGQSAGDILYLIMSQQNRRYLVKHLTIPGHLLRFWCASLELTAHTKRYGNRCLFSSGIAIVLQVARLTICAFVNGFSPSNNRYDADVKSLVISSAVLDPTSHTINGRTSFSMR